MKTYVEGYISNNNPTAKNFFNRLNGLGYDVNEHKFKKYGQIEAIVNELVPYAENEGIDVFTELYLEEYDQSGNLAAKYQKGRVNRLD